MLGWFCLPFDGQPVDFSAAGVILWAAIRDRKGGAMDQNLSGCLRGLRFGEPRRNEQLTVLPLFSDNPSGPDYVTLSQALTGGKCRVTEVNEAGSVPNLKVENNGDCPVLLLDAEELYGAKQNRVLNTTILVKEKTTTFVPVSCTEAGRWHYTSPAFADAETIMSPSIRYQKMSSVSASLTLSLDYRSNQRKVWEEIACPSKLANAHSPTRALHKVYELHDNRLKDYQEAIGLEEGQTGLLVLIGDRVVGLDYVSRPEAFAELYPKLLKSYALDALFSNTDKLAENPARSARDFLEIAVSTKESKHPSVGWGDDYRFTGEGLVGSALEAEGEIIHFSFLCHEKPKSPKGKEGESHPFFSVEPRSEEAQPRWKRWFGF